MSKEILLVRNREVTSNYFPKAPLDQNNVELELLGGSLQDYSGKDRMPINTTDLLTISSFDLGSDLGSLQCGSNKRLNYGTLLPEPGLDEFTFELFIYFTGFIIQSPKYCYLFGKGDGISSNNYTSWLISDTDNESYFTIWPTGSSGNKNYIPSNIKYNKLHHLVWCRKNNETDSQYLMFVDGTSNSNKVTISKNTTLVAGAIPFTIGDRASGSLYDQYPWNGYLFGFRYTKGECIYTEDFNA